MLLFFAGIEHSCLGLEELEHSKPSVWILACVADGFLHVCYRVTSEICTERASIWGRGGNRRPVEFDH